MNNGSSYEIHKQKLMAIQERVLQNYSRVRAKSYSRPFTFRENQRQIEIIRENQCLVKKLTTIFHKKSPLQHNESYNFTNCLNSYAARRAKEIVNAENKRLDSRILTISSIISKKKQDVDYKANLVRTQQLKRIRNSNQNLM